MARFGAAALLVALALVATSSPPCLAKPPPPRPPRATVTKIADGFSWAENLWPMPNGDVFVSDFGLGLIIRLQYNPKKHDGDNSTLWNKTTWVSGFHQCAGITGPRAYAQDSLYALCELKNGTDTIVQFSTTQPETFTPIFVSPNVIGNLTYNGIAFNDASGWIYVTNLGNFAPNQGTISAIDSNFPQNGMKVLVSNLSSADGCFWDANKNYLFISEVFTGHVHAYDLNGIPGAVPPQVYSYIAPGMKSLDDMCVTKEQYVFAADFNGGNVVSFPIDGSGTGDVLATNFTHPTSVRRGRHPNLLNSFFVTDGAGSVFWLMMHY